MEQDHFGRYALVVESFLSKAVVREELGTRRGVYNKSASLVQRLSVANCTVIPQVH
jgi:hypothetical protein